MQAMTARLDAHAGIADARAPTDARAYAPSFWRSLVWACSIASALPLWTASRLPICDLPEHVAAIATLRHWFDPLWRGQETFTLAFGKTQYVLYYVAGALLAVPLGAERANLVLLSAIAIAFPFALRALLRAVGRDERLCLFGCVLFWNQALMVGFFNFLASVPILIWGLALVVRNVEMPTRRRALGIAAIAVAIFYLHICSFLFFGVASAIVTLMWPSPSGASLRGELADRVKAFPRRMAWCAPSLVLAVVWLVTSPAVHPKDAGWVAPRTVHFDSIATSLSNIDAALLDVWAGCEDEIFALALVAAVALLAWPSSRGPEETRESSWRRGVIAGLVATAALLYFAFPDKIGVPSYLNDRFALFAVLLGVTLLRVPSGLRGRLALGLVAAASLFAAATAVVKFRAFDVEVGRFDRVLAAAVPGTRVMSLVYDRESSITRYTPYLHFGAYHRVRGGGVAEVSFAILPHSPLRYRQDAAPPSTGVDREWHPERYNNLREGAYYDYVLVRGDARMLTTQAGPAWRLIAREGSWQLFTKSDSIAHLAAR